MDFCDQLHLMMKALHYLKKNRPFQQHNPKYIHACLQHIYFLIDQVAEEERDLDHQIGFNDMAAADLTSLSIQYLSDESQLRYELWRMFKYYDKGCRVELSAQIRHEKMHKIIVLLRNTQWNQRQTNLARQLIDQAILYHLYEPGVRVFSSSCNGHCDETPF